MTHIAFFGHDARDAAIRRRAEAFAVDGFDVTGFMMRRSTAMPTDWTNIDLGKTQDGAFLQRICQVFTGAGLAIDAETELRAADIIYARNLDMLACAFLAKRKLKLTTPVVYECLDVHRLLVRQDPIGFVLRRIEHALLKRCHALVVSSPGFVDHHFRPRYGIEDAILVENRMTAGMEYGMRPTSLGASPGQPLRIGWFGILRCSRSLDLLTAIADALGDKVEVVLRGRVSGVEIPDFHARIAGYSNVLFEGAYKAPEDLTEIYEKVDIVWAGDFMEAGYNSVWLLPNRLYEGGFYAVPPIAPAGTQTAKWIADHACGFKVAEPLQETLPDLINMLADNHDAILQKRENLLNLPDDMFVQPPGFMKALIEQIVSK